MQRNLFEKVTVAQRLRDSPPFVQTKGSHHVHTDEPLDSMLLITTTRTQPGTSSQTFLASLIGDRLRKIRIVLVIFRVPTEEMGGHAARTGGTQNRYEVSAKKKNM